jgi:hypothetical protein
MQKIEWSQIEWPGEEPDALSNLNPVAAMAYLFVLAFAVTAFLH